MKRWIFVLPALAMILFASCKLVFDTEATESYDKEFKVADGYNKIDLDNEAGEVNITTSNTDVIHVKYIKKCMGTSERDAEKHLNDIDITLSGDTSTGVITIVAEFPDVDVARNYEVTFTIIMPDTIDLDIVNTTGDINIIGLSKAPKLEATTGDITLDLLDCGINAKTTTGHIGCTIDILPSNENVTMETTTGDHNLVIASMDTTHAIDIRATSGKVDIMLPANVNLEFDLQVNTGEVRIEGYDPDYTEESNKKAVGTIGDAETKATLDAQTETGYITLKAMGS